MMERTQEQNAALEVNLRSMSWKALTKELIKVVEAHHDPVELPDLMRRWIEVNRGTPATPQEAEHVAREVDAIQDHIDRAKQDAGLTGWAQDKTEVAPISGWVITASHWLKDGARWWLWSAQRHDDRAPLVGTTVPAPATAGDLRKLGKVIAYAGGNPKRELLRTGAITKEEHDDFIAAGKPDIAAYGQIFFWWKH